MPNTWQIFDRQTTNNELKTAIKIVSSKDIFISSCNTLKNKLNGGIFNDIPKFFYFQPNHLTVISEGEMSNNCTIRGDAFYYCYTKMIL